MCMDFLHCSSPVRRAPATWLHACNRFPLAPRASIDSPVPTVKRPVTRNHVVIDCAG
jgi:hypothetical protein